jgi:putative nucleotidyltransferase with HDIG domain
MGIRSAGDTSASEATGEGRPAGVRPLAAHELDSALQVIEAAQTLARGDDLAEMLAGLARQLTEFTDSTACLISVVDLPRGVIRNRAGYARPPHRWSPSAAEHPIAEYPRTQAVIETGRPYICVRGTADADPSEAKWLRRLGYTSLLMLRLAVDGEPFALIELYDERSRRFAGGEVRLCQALAAEAGLMVARAQMAERLEEAYIATLGALAAALEAKDAYTNDHASQIADLAGAVCDHLGVPSSDTRIVRLGALLHDIGKIGIPEEILRKPGPLTDEEMRRMQEHPDIGARILEPVPYFAEMVPLVRSSHERFDGRGYPDGLSGGDIPLGSRVIAVCDAYHAMTEDRVYRKALSLEGAIKEIERCSGTQFDPACAAALIAVVRGSGPEGIARERVMRIAQHS